MINKRRIAGLRKASGASISEFGPALGLLLLGIFFPLLNLMGIGISYADCAWLNHMQCHEAALTPWSDATSTTGSIQKAIPDNWKGNGIGQFVQLVSYPVTSVTYRPGQVDVNGITDQIVRVETDFVVKPFLTIPSFGLAVPGISAPVSFGISCECPMENPDYAQSAS